MNKIGKGEIAATRGVGRPGPAVPHEVPYLGADPDVPIACEAGDAGGLRRVVEAQARGLVRLRRALAAAETIAAQRLALLRSGTAADSADEDASRFEKAGALRDEISRVQQDVHAVLNLSRWRMLGLRFGVAKRTPWESENWRSALVPISSLEVSEAHAGSEPSLAELHAELCRLLALREELGRSRWRQLGQRLGLAKRMAWEMRGQSAPPTRQVEGAVNDVMPATLTAPPPSSYEGFIEYTSRRFLEECRGFSVDVILDVGANVGQFVHGLRRSGYHGQVVSFEPLSEAHAALAVAAAEDPLWDVVARCAVGATNGSAEINVAGNSFSSSLLPMLDAHRNAAPESAYCQKEVCPVVTLETFIDSTFSDPTVTFGLKIDTQGFEAQVLAGLGRHSDRVKVILCEMSLVPLYEGGPTMVELCQVLASRGFRCVALGPEFENPATGELLQADGVFVRRD